MAVLGFIHSVCSLRQAELYNIELQKGSLVVFSEVAAKLDVLKKVDTVGEETSEAYGADDKFRCFCYDI